MTFSIKIKNSDFTKYVARVMPHIELASLFSLIGVDQQSSLKNYAGDGQPMTVLGTPQYFSNYCTLSQVNGFEGPMAAAGTPFTHIAIITAATSDIGYCGNWDNGPTSTANLLNRQGTNLNLAIDGNLRVSTPMTPAGFQFIAGSHDGSTANVYLGSSNTLTKNSVAYAGGAVRKSKFRIGGNQYGTGTFNASAVVTFNSVLDDQKIEDIYLYLKEVMQSRGISVV